MLLLISLCLAGGNDASAGWGALGGRTSAMFFGKLNSKKIKIKK